MRLTWGCCWCSSDRSGVHTRFAGADTGPVHSPHTGICFLECLQSGLWILHEEARSLQGHLMQTHLRLITQLKKHAVFNSTETDQEVYLVRLRGHLEAKDSMGGERMGQWEGPQKGAQPGRAPPAGGEFAPPSRQHSSLLTWPEEGDKNLPSKYLLNVYLNSKSIFSHICAYTLFTHWKHFIVTNPNPKYQKSFLSLCVLQRSETNLNPSVKF